MPMSPTLTPALTPTLTSGDDADDPKDADAMACAGFLCAGDLCEEFLRPPPDDDPGCSQVHFRPAQLQVFRDTVDGMFREMQQLHSCLSCSCSSDQRMFASVDSRQKYSIGVAAAFVATAILIRRETPEFPALPIESKLFGGPAGVDAAGTGSQQPAAHGATSRRPFGLLLRSEPALNVLDCPRGSPDLSMPGIDRCFCS